MGGGGSCNLARGGKEDVWPRARNLSICFSDPLLGRRPSFQSGFRLGSPRRDFGDNRHAWSEGSTVQGAHLV
jgi:hypothetical protein